MAIDYTEPRGIWDGIAVCPIHDHTSQGCEGCTAQLQAYEARLEQINAEASDRVRGIVQSGGAPPDQAFLIGTRLDVLIDSVIRDPKQRFEFEGEMGRRVMLAVKEMQAALRQPRIEVARDIPQHMKGRKV